MTATWIATALLACTGIAGAQPAPQPAPPPDPPKTDKLDAAQLMSLGVKLFDEKNFLGALAVFKDAYLRFPSTKILLNIGVTLSRLDRKAEAANTYQRYLDSPDADPKKKPDIELGLVELDKKVGVLEVAITPAGAEVQINEDEWIPADRARIYRVPDGTYRVRVRKDKFQAETKSAQVAPGERVPVRFVMSALPEEVKVGPIGNGNGNGNPTGIVGGVRPDAPRSRAGLYALAHIDIAHEGAAARVGLSFDITKMIQVQGAGILGPTFGAYVGGQISFLDGKLRPMVAAGMPVFFSSGTRFAVRGAGGVEYLLSRNIALIAEVGVEYMINPEDDADFRIKDIYFVPAVGASGRL